MDFELENEGGGRKRKLSRMNHGGERQRHRGEQFLGSLGEQQYFTGVVFMTSVVL